MGCQFLRILCSSSLLNFIIMIVINDTTTNNNSNDDDDDDDDLEAAHPHSRSGLTFLVELEVGNLGFRGQGKSGVPEEKHIRAK